MLRDISPNYVNWPCKKKSIAVNVKGSIIALSHKYVDIAIFQLAFVTVIFFEQVSMGIN